MEFQQCELPHFYSGVLTAVLPVSVLGGFAPKKTSFEEITVQRVNVVEPDGTLRMVISDESRLPGIIIKGREHPHPNRRTAGILFFNDEGTENGGLRSPAIQLLDPTGNVIGQLPESMKR